MAKRNLIWHIGPEDPGAVLLPRLLEADPGADFHSVTALEAADADLDLRWAHESVGRTRKDVEGAWSRVECRVWHTRGIWILSTPAAHLATEDQRRLAMDGLRGVKVQVVIVRTPHNATAVEEIAARWVQPLHPERLHVVDTDGSAEAAWQALFDVAGLPSRPVPASATVLPGTAAAGVLEEVIDLHAGRAEVTATAAHLLAGGPDDEDEPAAAARALGAAAEELASAEQRIRELMADNERLDRKRRKHKNRVRELLAEPSTEELEHVTV